MSIIKRYRKETLTENNEAKIYSKISFMGIPVWYDECTSTSNAVLNQFIDFNVEQPTTGLYDVTKIGFKRE